MIRTIGLFLRECVEYIALLIVNLFSVIGELLICAYEDGGILWFSYISINLEIALLILYRRSSAIIGFMSYSFENIVLLSIITVIIGVLIRTSIRNIVLGYILLVTASLGVWIVINGDIQISFVHISLSIAAALAYFSYKYSRLYFQGKHIRDYRKRILKIWISSLKVGCLCMFAGLSVITIKESIYSGRRVIAQTGMSSNVTVIQEQVFSENRQVMDKFRQENWVVMTKLEKEEACYELMQLTMVYLTGSVDRDTRYIIGKDYLDGAGGFYSEAENCIVADEKYFTNEYREYNMKTVFHETFHWFQNEVIEKGAEVDVRNLLDEERIETYDYEFDNYIDITEDYDGYYAQACESDARKFADKMLEYVWGR